MHVFFLGPWSGPGPGPDPGILALVGIAIGAVASVITILWIRRLSSAEGRARPFRAATDGRESTALIVAGVVMVGALFALVLAAVLRNLG